MPYDQAYAAFVAALDALEAAALTLQTAERNLAAPPNHIAHHLVSHLEGARLARGIRLPELRRVLQR
jgi:hypothetical protein